ncbi:MAG: vitamin B12-dependent ribonucleotide reductase [Planctomycetes bacterium]|nr:vitamin B12-dependent ribonucleotide reductase [Planctomycetota bacterium]
MKGGLTIGRRYCAAGESPFAGVEYETRRAVIQNPDGSVVFEMQDVRVPASFSQLATDIMVSKYFRKAGVPGTGHETSAEQVVRRITHAVRQAGERQGGYFATAQDAQAFEDELSAMLIRQVGAFNSPVWFNTGLAEAYGIKGNPTGSWAWDEASQTVRETRSSYERPQVSACFIQSVQDDLMDIASGIQREMRLFKFGSGTGGNFSRLRAKDELLSGGGHSSGLISFLEVYDRAAGAIKSGGTTRRAAKMVCVDMDHPDVVEFIRWKAKEEDKALALIEAGYDSDFNGEAYRTISGQNANNSVRASDAFMQAVTTDGKWSTTWRTNGQVAKTYKARELMREIAQAAWRCADPGMQFDTTCNEWNTVSATGRINATNPCSEFSFLDETSCNLASINLLKFLGDDGSFDVEGYRHACSVFFMAQEILVDYASYPAKEIAQRTHELRPLGLGYANLGSLLMTLGLPYDSNEAREVAAVLTAIMTGTAYETSARMAATKGPFPAYEPNRGSVLKVMHKHRDAAYRLGTTRLPELTRVAQRVWDDVLAQVMEHGLRNAQATVLAPTGTIGLLMDCDTTGVEPEFSLVKFKKLAGGGSFKIVNTSVARALTTLGYTQSQVQAIVDYVRGSWTFEGTPCVNRRSLLAKGFLPEEVAAAEAAMPGAYELRHAFTPRVLGAACFSRLKAAERSGDPTFDLLAHVGFGQEEIQAAEEVICGRMTIEGAPYLRDEHLPVFDCANRCGAQGVRFIPPMGHVRLMAAVQPFLSGAISKTCNLPNETTVEEIEEIYLSAWKMGLKAVAVYRDGSKGSQVLQSKARAKESAGASAGAARTPRAPARRPLPKRRPGGFLQEIKVGGQKVYIRTGEYEDGTLGEVFIDMHKEGATLRSLMNCFAISVSMGLQHGVPLEEFVSAFTFTRFEPQGLVEGHPNIKVATSVMDVLFRLLAFEYLDRDDLVHVKPAQLDQQAVQSAAVASASEAHLSSLGDGPLCSACGHTTVRNGTCYRCLNCGSSMGCS